MIDIRLHDNTTNLSNTMFNVQTRDENVYKPLSLLKHSLSLPACVDRFLGQQAMYPHIMIEKAVNSAQEPHPGTIPGSETIPCHSPLMYTHWCADSKQGWRGHPGHTLNFKGAQNQK